MNNILKAMEKIAENEGITITKLEQNIGASKGVLSRAISNNSDIQSKWLLNLVENYPRYRTDWIITGAEPMLKKSNVSDADIVPVKVNRKTKDKIYEEQEVPLYDIEVAAGLKDILDNTKSQRILDMIRIPGLPKCDGALPATGDSMYPLLKAGDLVCFRRASFDSIFWGEMYILDLQIDDWDTILTVKFIQKSDIGEDYVKLVSQNQHHQPKDVRKDQIRAIAMVKATIRINSMI
ncbi:S24 family peptidase [Epilithonimonas vandammei]|uniref:S24 family peptidase n=1 Tax=Epilithonimonas vandammei TaxID=2487072 RepID=A0A3G8ZB68_9FLAO|nr:S24 family peptidase [Epilithonimonas vandammei]AZI53867.1 S24 family peptidase [Epilithonimonas vandammei]AZI55714.1 S24 family peptidase [Epilithonimonas vandammei]